MDRRVDLVLLTGFLGSGKTTLLNGLLSGGGRKTGVLINEFGRIGVDGALVRQASGTDDDPTIYEVADGSIFCTCRSGSFVAGLRMFARLPDDRRPARLIVEASGMSDPSGLSRLLAENRLAGDYTVSRVVCLLDPVSFRKLRGTLPAITRQAEAADLIVINKIDLSAREEIDSLEAELRGINPRADIVRTTFAAVRDEEVWEGTSADRSGELVSCSTPQSRPAAVHLTCTGARRAALNQFLSESLEETYRVKGWVEADGDWFFVSDNSGRIEWKPDSPPAGAVPGLTVICPPAASERILRRWRALLEPDESG